jgi:hypothetical protein
MDYPVVNTIISERELYSLNFKPSAWSDGGLFHTSFVIERNELKLDVTTVRDTINNKLKVIEQVVTIELCGQWEYVAINDFNELKTLTQILFK